VTRSLKLPSPVRSAHAAIALHVGDRPGIEERRPGAARLFQPQQADVVVPPLEEGESHRLVLERAGEERQVLADELFLQVDRVGRDDRALAVLRGPAQRRDQVA
jgi:hypothetical protein